MSFSSFLSLLKGKKLLILTHLNADIDAFCSAKAMQFLLEQKGFQVEIGIPDHISLPAKNLSKKLNIEYSINPNPKEFDGLVLVDFNSFSRLGSLENSVRELKEKPIFLIDHHSPTEEKISLNVLTPKEHKFVSTCELVYTLFEEQKIELNPEISLILLCGIFVDSVNLHIANFETLEIFSKLLKNTKKGVSDIYSFVHLESDFSLRIARLKSAKRLKIFKLNNYIICLTSVSAFESLSASSLIHLGADIAFAGSLNKNLIRISGRASDRIVKDENFNLSKIMQQLSKFFDGSGGGHEGAAGFNCKGEELQSVLEKCLFLSVDFLKQKNPKMEVKDYSD